MPLHKGSSKRIIRKNIQEMIEAGHSPAQAEAAAYERAGKYRKKSPAKKKPAKRSARQRRG